MRSGREGRTWALLRLLSIEKGDAISLAAHPHLAEGTFRSETLRGRVEKKSSHAITSDLALRGDHVGDARFRRRDGKHAKTLEAPLFLMTVLFPRFEVAGDLTGEA